MTTEQKTKTVRLEPEVMDTLADMRQGFESPNDCLKRVLSNPRNCNPKSNPTEKEPTEKVI